MRNKITKKELTEKILHILEWEGREMSIREIKIRLEKDFEIKKSPQIIKRILMYLKKTGKLN